MSYTSQQVLKYIKKIHKKGFSLDHTVQNHAEWELENIPVADLKIASEDDPYNRVLDLDHDHVNGITKQDILAHAIVADENGHIIDGNHRAAKAQALGMSHIPAFIPVADPDNETYDQFMKRKQTNEVTIDNKNGAGAVPYNQDVDYFGLRVKMKPSTFIRLAAPLGREHSPELEKYIAGGGAIGAPFLDIVIPKEWDDGSFAEFAKVQGHEGRNRMLAVQKLEGDAPVEVHLFPKGGYRSRDLTPEYVEKLQAGLYAEKSSTLVRGPLFENSVTEASEEPNRVREFIKAMYDKYPVWPMDGNQRTMVWGTGEEQQFAVFELKPSLSKRGSVEVAWFAAYPLRQGVGTKAMAELQKQAREYSVGLTLFPWDKGQVSQSKLMKFYKQSGFKPAQKGGKAMAWENISEAFDQPYPITWEDGDGTYDALARLPDGHNLSINFNLESGEDYEDEEEWHVEFWRNNSLEVTGDGDAQRIFATVLVAIQEFIKKEDPARISFSASKEVEPEQNSESRSKLYDRLVQRYARSWGYKAFRADNGRIVIYQLSRLKKKVSEGGWASVETQNTVITPRTIVEIIEALKTFEASYNVWQSKQGFDTEIKIGGPKGSGTYYRRDLEQDPEREYGDVDVECFIHSREGVTSAQRITEYKSSITEYCLQSPDYSTENGTNIIMKTSSGAVQVDLIYTYHEHADWSRALSPEYRVKGVISTSLTSSLAEVLNLSFSSQGIQVKIRNNQPVSFRQSKDTELRTVSTTPETWAQDIYSLYYYLSNGTKPTEFPGGLKAHGGLKDEQRLSDIVLAIKSLANAMEMSGLLGHGSLISIHNKQDLIRKVASVYSKKLETAENSSKFDKASTPAAVEKAKKTKLMLAKYRNEITKLLLN